MCIIKDAAYLCKEFVRVWVGMFGRSVGESVGWERIGEFMCSKHTYRSRGDAFSHVSRECLIT